MYTIRLLYLAEVTDKSGERVNSLTVLSALDGKKDNKANIYYWLSSKFDDLRVTGGNVKLVANKEKAELMTEVLFYTPSQLSEANITELSVEVAGQLSDGYGEEPWFRTVKGEKYRIDLLSHRSYSASSINQKKGGPNIYIPYRSPLFTLIEKGEIEEARTFINRKELHSHDKWGATPLIYAISYGYTELSKEMIRNGADVNGRGRNFENSPLRIAVQRENIKITKSLVRYGAYVNEQVLGDKATALMHACRTGNIAIINYLLLVGADLYCKDKSGKEAFEWVSQRNHELVKLLNKKSRSPIYHFLRKLRIWYESFKKQEQMLQQSRLRI